MDYFDEFIVNVVKIQPREKWIQRRLVANVSMTP